MNTTDQRPLATYCFLLLVLAYVAFIAAASFYFTGSGTTHSRSILDRLFGFGWQGLTPSWHNVRDISTNIALYMPYGLLVGASLACKRSLRFLHPAIFIGLLTSLIVEVTQPFIHRYSDPTDVISNSLGYLLGYLCILVAVKRFRLHPPHLLGMELNKSGDEPMFLLEGLRFLCIALFIIISLLPFDISVTLSDIYAKLHAARGSSPHLILDPLYHFEHRDITARSISLMVLGFAPLAIINALIGLQARRRFVFNTTMACFLLAMITEFMQIFVRSARSDVLTIFIALLSGFGISFLLQSLSKKTLASSQHPITNALFLGTLYVILLAVIAWAPFDFERNLDAIKFKLLHESNWIPFRLHFSTRSLAAALDIVRETLLYVPLGLLAGYLIQHRTADKKPAAYVLAAIFGLALGLALEISQSIVIGRYIDLTDSLLACLGTVMGTLLFPAVKASLKHKPV